jgi:hypothetical protein
VRVFGEEEGGVAERVMETKEEYRIQNPESRIRRSEEASELKGEVAGRRRGQTTKKPSDVRMAVIVNAVKDHPGRPRSPKLGSTHDLGEVVTTEWTDRTLTETRSPATGCG